MDQKIKLGFCPIGKFAFSHEDALVYKAKLEKRMQELGVEFIGIDSVIPDGVIRGYEHIGPAVEWLKSQKVDCLFIPHCNFGTESAAGMIAHKLGVPTLLWGPIDHAPLEDGSRLRDSLCGLFASSKVLTKLGVPFSYIENCEVEDPAFSRGLDRFLRATNVVKRMKGARIGLVGNRIDFFWSTIVNESELLQKFGIEILPIDLHNVIGQVRARVKANHDAYAAEAVEIGRRIDTSAYEAEHIVENLAFRDVIYQFVTDNQLAAVAIETFMSIVYEFKTFFALGSILVSDMGIPCICESDIHGAISSIMLEAAAMNESPSFFADITIRHPENPNGFLLWHDSFPLSLKAEDSPAKIDIYWILTKEYSGMCHYRLKDGEVTVMRFDGERGQYQLFAETARTIPGPFTQNTYVWVESKDFPALERKVIYGPYIHHTSCIYGDYTDVLAEACRFIDHLTFDA